MPPHRKILLLDCAHAPVVEHAEERVVQRVPHALVHLPQVLKEPLAPLPVQTLRLFQVDKLIHPSCLPQTCRAHGSNMPAQAG